LRIFRVRIYGLTYQGQAVILQEDMVIRQISMIGIIIALAIVSSACASTPAPTPQGVATQGVAPTKTTIPVPPQPTSATLAPRTAVPFVSPTSAARVQPAGGASLPVAAAATSAPAAVVAAAPTQLATTSAGPASTVAGVATGKRSEVKFVFLTPLKPAEEAEPPELVQMRAELKKVPGFIEVSDIEDGMGATVGYDAGLITVEQLMVKFADLKHPVKRQ